MTGREQSATTGWGSQKERIAKEAGEAVIAPHLAKSVQLSVEDIEIPTSHRSTAEDQILSLMDSIRAIGMQNPITVREKSKSKYQLVAGAHRLRAVLKLGHSLICARIVCRETAQIFTISENLHRVELTKLERAEAIAKYIELRKKGGPDAQPARGGKQPLDKGNSRIARELGFARKIVRNAKKIAQIDAKAKLLLRANGLDDVEKTLVQLAEFEPEDQLKQVEQLIGVQPPQRRKKSTAKATCGLDLGQRADLIELKRHWCNLKFRVKYERAPDVVQMAFIKQVLRTAEK